MTDDRLEALAAMPQWALSYARQRIQHVQTFTMLTKSEWLLIVPRMVQNWECEKWEQFGTIIAVWWSMTTTRHWLHSTFFSRPMHSAVYHRWQSIFCCICSSVKQSSIACHHCSIFLSAFHSHLKSHLLSYPNFLLFFSFFTCSVPVQWLNFGHCNHYNYYILHLSRSHSQNVRNWSTRLSVRHVQLLSMTVTLCCCQMVCIQTELMSIIQDCFLFYCSCLVDITRICRLFTEWILPV